MRNVAFAGQMGAGKSTAARYLASAYGYQPRNISEPIYDLVEKLWGPEARSDRALLQDVGSKLREIDQGVWVNHYVRSLPTSGHVVNDTLRFPNEYWALADAGFVTIRVNCPEAVRVDRLMKINRIQDHARLIHDSEVALIGARAEAEGIKFDYEVWNDADDPRSLYDELDRIMDKIEEEE